jgi:hypothetical protein
VARNEVSQAPAATGWLVLLVLALLFALAPLPDWMVEQFYSRGVYPTLQIWITTVTNLVPVAILDLMILGALCILVLRTSSLFVAVRKRGVISAAWEAIRRLVRAASIITIVFMWVWGFNYRRVPLETALGGNTPHLSADLLQTTVADANALAVRVRQDKGSQADMSYDDIAKILPGPMNDALQQIGREPLGMPGRPKFSLVLTPFFTWTGVDGMINPLALESIVHPDLLPFERPYVLAHEWGHLSGHADEAEASAVGWLACMNGPPPFAYSASLYLIMEARVALPPDLRASATAALDPAVRSDIDAIADRLQKEQPEMQHAASQVYDEYLKANRVEDGNASYGRALTIILMPTLRDAMAKYRPTANQAR